MSFRVSGAIRFFSLALALVACASEKEASKTTASGGGGGTIIGNGGGDNTVNDTDSGDDGERATDLDGGDDMDSDTVVSLMCVENTHDETECYNCCGCLTVSCEEKIACRASCVGHLYDDNRWYIDVPMPEERGEFGEYLACTIRGESPACRECCLCAEYLQCGDVPHCEAACDDLS